MGLKSSNQKKPQKLVIAAGSPRPAVDVSVILLLKRSFVNRPGLLQLKENAKKK
jgi:hypothetical protein